MCSLSLVVVFWRSSSLTPGDHLTDALKARWGATVAPLDCGWIHEVIPGGRPTPLSMRAPPWS